MKALGKDIREFYEKGFPDGFYCEDMTEDIMDEDGEFTFADTDMVTINGDFGYVVPENANLTGKVRTFKQVFAQWMKERTTTTVVVTVAKEDEARLRSILEANGFTFPK